MSERKREKKLTQLERHRRDEKRERERERKRKRCPLTHVKLQSERADRMKPSRSRARDKAPSVAQNVCSSFLSLA